MDQALARLSGLAAAAIATLEALLASANEAVRLGAAKAVLDYRERLEERRELAARVKALESAIAGRVAQPTLRPFPSIPMKDTAIPAAKETGT